jgi:hypothetical protein
MFDIWGAEKFAEFLVPAHARVIDAHEEHGVGIIDFEVTGSPVVPLLLAIAAALLALGITVALITVSIQVPKDIKWIFIVVGVTIVVAIAVSILVWRKT